MSMEEFFSANAGEDGTLNPEQMAALLTGGEGDTGAPLESGELPDTTIETQEEVAAEPVTEPEPEPVLLAKDGKHIIEYEKLVEAREEARALKAMLVNKDLALAEKEQRILELSTATATAQQTGDTTDLDALVESMREDFPEIVDLMDKKMASVVGSMTSQIEELKSQLAPLKQAAVKSVEDAHLSAIVSKHPDALELANDGSLNKWVAEQPSFTRSAFEAVLASGTSEQVVELLDLYKGSTVAKPQQPAPRKEVVVEKRPVPNSLSNVPGATAPHHDENEAMLNMSSQNLLDRFAGKTPDQILDLMSRVV